MIKNICFLARTAGAAIMKIYQNEKNNLNIMQKKDLSPITTADIIAHKIIIKGLKNLTPDIPIISEESDINLNKFKNIKRYWLVDPLDGTKEFINRNGEFTVNIALIDNTNPILGVIYAPAMNILYAAEKKKHGKKKTK